MTKTLSIAVVGLLALSIYLMVSTLNAATALDDARSQERILKKRNSLTLKILNKVMVGQSSERLMQLSAELEKEGVIVKKSPQALEVQDLKFELANDKVVGASVIE